MGECGACETNGSLVININITVEGDIVYEDQCTYIDNVYMEDEGEGVEIVFDSEE